MSLKSWLTRTSPPLNFLIASASESMASMSRWLVGSLYREREGEREKGQVRLILKRTCDEDPAPAPAPGTHSRRSMFGFFMQIMANTIRLCWPSESILILVPCILPLIPYRPMNPRHSSSLLWNPVLMSLG